jgi:hypothetical protein
VALTDSLIAYWSLDEASGNALDSHGSNDLTDNNTVGSATGKVGNARDFEQGNEENFSRADNTDLSTGDIDFTFNVWVKLESKAGGNIVVAKWDAGQFEFELFYAIADDNWRWLLSFDGSNQKIIESANNSAPATGVWQMLTVWHDSVNNVGGIAINAGTPVTSSHTTGVRDGTSAFRVGMLTGSSNAFDGLIDELGFWKRVLTSAERTELYNNGSGRDYNYILGGTIFNTADWDGYDEATWTNPTSSLTNFSGLIDISTLSASWKAAIQSDGEDIRITKGDNTELAYDLIDFVYNAGSPTGWIRFLWTGSLASSGTQTVRVWAGYNGGGSARGYNNNETYGQFNAYDANWLGYWPMFEDPSGSAPQVMDRTSNARNLSSNGSMTSGDLVAGKVGNALDFDGSDDAFSDFLSGTAPALGTSFTMMAWARPITGINAGINAIITTGNNWENGATLGYAPSNFDFYPIASYNSAGIVGATNSVVDSWYHTVGVLTGGNATIYRNGASDGTNATAGTPTHGFFRIGLSASVYGFKGQIDDVQIHNTNRSSDWIAEEYAQSNNQSTFWGTWSWSASGGSPSVVVIKRLIGILTGGTMSQFNTIKIGGRL